MKVLGIILVGVVLLVLGFFFFSFLNKTPQNLSPIQEDDGVKVIYETPSQ